MTYTEQLAEVQDAITKILTKGQSWSAGGASLTRADLPTLEAREKRLIPLVARETRNARGARVRGITPVDV